MDPSLGPVFESLLGLPGAQADAAAIDPMARRRKIQEGLYRWFQWVGEQRPLVVLIEDLQWADPSTLEFFGGLMGHEEIRALVIGTHRPDYRLRWPWLPHMSAITLPRLSPDDCRTILRALAVDHPISASDETQIIERGEGVPLFVEELGLSAIETGGLVEGASPRLSGGESVPAPLLDPLMARLDRLREAKPLVQTAAVLGRRFPLELLRAVDEDEASGRFDDRLERVLTAGILDRSAAVGSPTLQFRHSLIRDVAYESLLRSRRSALHGRVATILSMEFPETAERQPELLGHHLARAGSTREAIETWLRAGRRAQAEAAFGEATRHLRRGLDLIAELSPGVDRDQLELRVIVSLLAPSVAGGGAAHPDVVALYGRAEALSHRQPDAPDSRAAERYLLLYHQGRGDHRTARVLAAQRVGALGADDSPVAHQFAQSQLAVELYALADFPGAERHAELALATYDPAQHDGLVRTAPIDPGMVARRLVANLLLHRGELREGEAAWRQVVEQSAEFRDPFSRAFVAGEVSLAMALLQQVDLARQLAEEASALAGRFDMAQSADRPGCVIGWANARDGQGGAAAEIAASVRRLEQAGSTVDLSRFLAMQIEALLLDGELEEAEAVLQRALSWSEEYGEAYHLPELECLGALLLHLQGQPAAAVAVGYARAATLARAHGDQLALLRTLTQAASIVPVDTTFLAELRSLLEEIHAPADSLLIERAVSALA